MIRLSLIASIALAGLAGAAQAQQPTEPARQCFRMSQVQGHTKGDDQTLYLAIRNKDVFRLGMAGNCLAGANSDDPLVMSPTSGNDVICKPLDLSLKVHIGPGALSPCIIKDITKLTPDQIAALPPKQRP